MVLLIQTRILVLPQSVEIDKRLVKKFSQGFVRAPAIAGEAKTGNGSPCLLPGWASWLLIRSEDKGESRGWAGVVGCFAFPFGGGVC